MTRWLQWAWKFLTREDGPTAVEYAVMLALILVVCIAAIGTVGQETNKSLADHVLLNALNTDE